MNDFMHGLLQFYVMAPFFWILGLVLSPVGSFYYLEFPGVVLFVLLELAVVLLFLYDIILFKKLKNEVLGSVSKEEILNVASELREEVFRASRKRGTWVDARCGSSYIMNASLDVSVDFLESEGIIERAHFLTPLTVRLTERGWELCLAQMSHAEININSEVTGMNGRVEGTYIIGNGGSFINSLKDVRGGNSVSNVDMSQCSRGSIDESLSRLVDCLREDSKNASQYERELALAHANEAERINTKKDRKGVDKFLDRLNGFLNAADSAFSATREVVKMVN